MDTKRFLLCSFGTGIAIGLMAVLFSSVKFHGWLMKLFA